MGRGLVVAEDKEEICDETEETLETFNEDEYLKRQKEFFKRNFERDQLRKKQRELSEKARKEVLAELHIEDDEREDFRESSRIRTSEVSAEEYKQLVEDINRLVARNTQIVNTFTDKAAIEKIAEERLSGNLVEEFINNEATLHTLLDRIQSINISIRHGESFIDSRFGEVAKRMTDRR